MYANKIYLVSASRYIWGLGSTRIRVEVLPGVFPL